ncbi:hypothetical protein EIP86_002841 [Pleurotus ostreatoroseus]|nr:hypothetical protein EIP86_002841 [Pleurotus ostreatoroseus]
MARAPRSTRSGKFFSPYYDPPPRSPLCKPVPPPTDHSPPTPLHTRISVNQPRQPPRPLDAEDDFFLSPPQVIKTDFDFEQALESALSEEPVDEEEDWDDAEGAELEPLDSGDASSRSPSPASTRSLSPPCGSSSVLPERTQPPRTRKSSYARKKRARKRRVARANADALDYRPSPRIAQVHGEPEVVHCAADASDFDRASGAWIGRRMGPEEDRTEPLTLQALLAAGFQHVPWRGGRPAVVADRKDRIIVVLAGQPVDDGTWASSMKETDTAVEKLDRDLLFGDSPSLPKPGGCATENRRGGFRTVSFGTSYGGGQKKPGTLKHTTHNHCVLKDFVANSSVRRSTRFGSSVLARFAPNIYAKIRRTTRALLKKHPHLQRFYRGTIFPCLSVNLGPKVVAKKHRDHNNLADGLCWILAGGKFDHTVGGQIVFWELKLVIDFPAGTGMLAPSAVISHENLPIGEGETRYSITQYAAGGLFRWVEYGFQGWRSFQQEEPERARTVWEERPNRWRTSINLFSKVSELAQDRETAFRDVND